jgi:hypothetical protein
MNQIKKNASETKLQDRKPAHFFAHGAATGAQKRATTMQKSSDSRQEPSDESDFREEDAIIDYQ